jgi:predicted GIY-YIG superfamily endonuclease
MIYLLHFDRPYHHARHYLGYAENVERRVAEHRKGHASKLTAAVVAAGIGFRVVRTWPGNRAEERRLKGKRSRRVALRCPVCHPPTMRAARPAAAQEAA